MDDHMTEDALEDAKKKKDWLHDDARLSKTPLRFFRAEQKAESVTNYFMRLKKITAELALLLPFSLDVKAQILSDSKIPSLDNAFTRVLRIESSPNGVSIPQSSSALISKNNNPQAPQVMDGNIASTCDIPEASVTISTDEYAKFQNYQDSLQASSSSTPVASTVAPGNTKCLLTSSTKWVIDSGAITHMTGSCDEEDYW
ncbi:gag-pol polyprotein [Cucumis melo var. makuwa]|uniref:Gag-pol polyprotein n=1 Tax=Cucumis melo var. makuwa TaxID=1194695 RepID=A0A5A7V9W4_CUCMM|nr:gag-pol polyprotein [Cucumis melo var. makuwa]TYK26166.1 gag-pol polyprotein [Cucumis melo var. makuwa]